MSQSIAARGPINHSPARWWLFGLISSLALYAISMAPGLLWGDSGEAQLHIILPGWYVNGEIVRSHVLYYALARFLYWLLPISATVAGSLVCVITGAITIANMAYLIATLCRSSPAILVGMFSIMFAHTFWQQATSAEVLTLTTALLTAELVMFHRWRTTGATCWLALAFFMNGLGVSNHNFALLMWPVYLFTAMSWPFLWKGRLLTLLPIALGALLIGMAPVLALCVDDYLTHNSFSHTLESFLVGHYGSKVSNTGRLPLLLLRSVGYTLLNFPTPVYFLALILGIVRFSRLSDRPMVWLYGGALLIYTLFAIRYDVPDQHTFLVPAFVLSGLIVALGCESLLEKCVDKPTRAALLGRLMVVLSLLPPLVYFAVSVALRTANIELSVLPDRHVPYRDHLTWFLHPWRTGYHGAERFARETLEVLPPDAWLVIDATLCPPVNYIQVAESKRKDVRLDCWLARQDWLDTSEDTLIAGRSKALKENMLFSTSNDLRYNPIWLRELKPTFEPTGFLYRVSVE